MRRRRIGFCFLAVAILIAIPNAPHLSSQARADTFPNCLNGHPGSPNARWPIKTSLQRGTNTNAPVLLPANAMVSAPDLLLNANDVRTLATSSGTVRALWSSRSFTHALLSGQVSPNPNSVFSVRLPAFNRATYQREYAQSPPGEKPTELGFLLASAFDAQPIPDPVSVGVSQVREGEIVTVEGYVYFENCETDRDYHFDIAAKSNGSDCFVAEVPFPGYVPNSALRTLVTQAREEAANLQIGDRVRIVGQFFYDAWHMPKTQTELDKNPGGSRGKDHCAQTLWEIHPIIGLQRL